MIQKNWQELIKPTNLDINALEGANAIVFGKELLEPIKVLSDFAKKHENITIEVTESMRLQDYQYFNKIFYKRVSYFAASCYYNFHKISSNQYLYSLILT